MNKEKDKEEIKDREKSAEQMDIPLMTEEWKASPNNKEKDADAKAPKKTRRRAPARKKEAASQTAQDEQDKEDAKVKNIQPSTKRMAESYMKAGSLKEVGSFEAVGSLKELLEHLKEQIFGDDAPNVDVQSIAIARTPIPNDEEPSSDNDSTEENDDAPPHETMKERRLRWAREQQERDKAAMDKIKAFNFTPKQIRDYLDRFVISQDEAKKVLAIAICDHYNHVRRCLQDPEKMAKPYAKHNVLMIGSTGVGKTYLMRCLANMLGVPFVKADATKYSETGYVGYDVDDIIRDLIKVADGNVQLAQFGIVYIDEIDKIASRNSDGGKDVSGRGVQINLLKLMEDSEIKVLSQSEMMNPMAQMMMRHDQPSTIHTKNILFIVSGAFEKICDIIRKRLGTTQIGFGVKNAATLTENEHELLKQIQTQDLVNFGFEPEFVGRLPVRVALADLDAGHLASILSSAENNVLQQYQEAFAGYGIHLDVLPEAIEEIARMAVAEKTGARGLLTILEHIFRDFKFELPGSGITELTIDKSTVHNPRGTLELLMQKP